MNTFHFCHHSHCPILCFHAVDIQKKIFPSYNVVFFIKTINKSIRFMIELHLIDFGAFRIEWLTFLASVFEHQTAESFQLNAKLLVIMCSETSPLKPLMFPPKGNWYHCRFWILRKFRSRLGTVARLSCSEPHFGLELSRGRLWKHIRFSFSRCLYRKTCVTKEIPFRLGNAIPLRLQTGKSLKY